jgi:hypothetical protein
MAIDFPASPTLNDVFTVGNVTYVWDGTKWTASVTGGISLDKIEEGNTSAEVIDTGSDGRFVVTTEGTERLRVTDTGRVGIGTASPNGNTNYGSLDLNGSAGGEIFFSSGGVSRGNIFNYSATPANLGIAATDASGQIIFNTGGYTERARIDNSGRLGIGTSAPISTLTCASTANNWAGSFGAAISQNQYTGISLGYGPNTQYHKGAIAFIRTDATNGAGDIAFCLGSTSNATNVAIGDEKVRITSTGRVGIGTASPLTNLQLHSPISGNGPVLNLTNDTGDCRVFFGQNSTVGDAYAMGQIRYNVANNTMAFYANGAERARLDASGRLLVGTSSFSGTANNDNDAGLIVEGNATDGGGDGRFIIARGAASLSDGQVLGALAFSASNHDIAAVVEAERDGGTWTAGSSQPTRLVFSTTANGASSPTERMRLRNNGELYLYSLNTTNTFISRNASSAGTTYAVFIGQHSSTSTTTGTTSIHIGTNGNVTNTNNSYGSLSDIKLKENIVDADSQWDDLKAFQVRNYNFKPETNQQTHTQIGLVAQEVELVSPGLVYESPDRDEDGNDLGTVTKSVNYSVLYMKAVKALQEAMERIETLEGMVAVNNITIDEQQHQLSTLAARLTALETP